MLFHYRGFGVRAKPWVRCVWPFFHRRGVRWRAGVPGPVRRCFPPWGTRRPRIHFHTKAQRASDLFCKKKCSGNACLRRRGVSPREKGRRRAPPARPRHQGAPPLENIPARRAKEVITSPQRGLLFSRQAKAKAAGLVLVGGLVVGRFAFGFFADQRRPFFAIIACAPRHDVPEKHPISKLEPGVLLPSPRFSPRRVLRDLGVGVGQIGQFFALRRAKHRCLAKNRFFTGAVGLSMRLGNECGWWRAGVYFPHGFASCLCIFIRHFLVCRLLHSLPPSLFLHFLAFPLGRLLSVWCCLPSFCFLCVSAILSQQLGVTAIFCVWQARCAFILRCLLSLSASLYSLGALSSAKGGGTRAPRFL